MADRPLPLTTLVATKAFLGLSGNSRDTEINALLYAISDQVARFLGRARGTSQYVEIKSRTEDYDVALGQTVWYLRATPIVTLTSVSFDASRVFGSGTALATTDYAFDAETGRLELIYDVYRSPMWRTRAAGAAIPLALRVVYTGGLATATQGIVSFAPVLEYCAHLLIKQALDRAIAGVERITVSGQAGTVGRDPMEWPPNVIQLLLPYRLAPMGSR